MHTQHKSFGGDDPQHPVETGRVVNTLAQPLVEEAPAEITDAAPVKPKVPAKPKAPAKPKKAKASA